MRTWIASWWDLVLCGVLATLHVLAITEATWRRSESQHGRVDSELWTKTVSSACTAGITAVSILLPLSVLVFQEADRAVARMLSIDVVIATWLLVFSLFCGLFVLYSLPRVSQRKDPARSAIVMMPFGLQLFALLGATIRVARVVMSVVSGVCGISTGGS
jgi:hypothetical protein